MARLALIAIGSCSVFAACTATNDALFDQALPLGNIARGASGGGGPVAAAPETPTEVAPPGESDPGTASAGSGGTAGTPRPPRPPRMPAASDAGVAADAGGAPPIPSVGDGSCGDQCAHNGGLCSDGTCFFDCQAKGSCAKQQVICPTGVPCDVTCGDGACTQNVLCNKDSTCNVHCAGERSCASELICEGECHVTCSGLNSCPGGTGGSVKLLDLKCTGRQSCGSTVQCEGEDCQVSCSGPQSCARVKIFATDNTLDCSGAGSCGTSVLCNGTRCRTRCADNACDNDINCQAVRCQELEDGQD